MRLLKPAPWIRQAVSVQKAPFRIRSAVRAAITIGVPFTIGAITGHIGEVMWFSLAGLLFTLAERPGVIYQRTMQGWMFVAPLAVSSFFIGYLEGIGTWLQILVLTAIAVVAAMAATWNSFAGAATAQILLIGSMVAGSSGGDWATHALIYALGSLNYAFWLVAFGLIFEEKREYGLLLPVFSALKTACEQRADSLEAGDLQVAGRVVAPTQEEDKLSSEYIRAYSEAAVPEMLQPRYLDVLEALDAVAARAWVSTKPDDLHWMADQLSHLETCLDQWLTAEPVTSPAGISSSVDDAINSLTAAVASYETSTEHARRTDVYPHKSALKVTRKQILARPSITNGARLGMAYALALLLGMLWPFPHVYWIATTVAMEMTPNPAAVVSRALQRSAGTLLGVAIGGGVILISNNTYWEAAVITALAFLLPWAVASSRLLAQVCQVPVMLLFTDILVPPTQGAVFDGEEKILATIVGSVIAVIFGYLLWPSVRRPGFSADFVEVHDALNNYLARVVRLLPSSSGLIIDTGAERNDVYAALVSFRQKVMAALSEPPPMSRSARAWVPSYLAAARVCDQITEVAQLSDMGANVDEVQAKAVLDELRALPEKPPTVTYDSENPLHLLADSVVVLDSRVEVSDATAAETQIFVSKHFSG